MYLYLDESGTDGRSDFVYVGGVYSDYKIRSNLIKKTIIKTFKKSPKINEYKFSNRNFDSRLKLKVITKISEDFNYVFYKAKADPRNAKSVICKLIAKCIKEVYMDNKTKEISVIYDRISERITKGDIEKNLDIKINFTFIMQDSNLEKGIQMADWIVGGARAGYIN